MSGRLHLSPEEMRSLGYQTVDLIVEHLSTLPEKSPTQTSTRHQLEALFDEAMPRTGTPPAVVLERIQHGILDRVMHLDHPRFFAFVPGPSNFVSVMADALAAGFNIFSGTWLEASAAAQIEVVTLRWLTALFNLPEGAGGLFTSGGSAANLTALAAARHVILNDDMTGAVAYFSDQAHSSIERALRILGFSPDQYRKLPSDGQFRIDVDALRQHIEADQAAGLRPFCVVATPGTTNTGAVDPLHALADLCAAHNLWLHADGAYGAAAMMSASGQATLSGLERAHSITVDPHKWLFQPYEMGCLLVRDRFWLRNTFLILPEYLQDASTTEETINFCDYGLQLTRGFRALKLWMSLQVFGADAFAEAIDHGITLAEHAGRLLDASADWHVVTPAQLGIITFQCRPEGLPETQVNALQRALAQAMLEEGYATVLSTRLHGQTVLRLCTIHPQTTNADIETTLQRLHRHATRLAPDFIATPAPV